MKLAFFEWLLMLIDRSRGHDAPRQVVAVKSHECLTRDKGGPAQPGKSYVGLLIRGQRSSL